MSLQGRTDAYGDIHDLPQEFLADVVFGPRNGYESSLVQVKPR